MGIRNFRRQLFRAAFRSMAGVYGGFMSVGGVVLLVSGVHLLLTPASIVMNQGVPDSGSGLKWFIVVLGLVCVVLGPLIVLVSARGKLGAGLDDA